MLRKTGLSVLLSLALITVHWGGATESAQATIPGTGELRVTTNPAVGSVITVDGVTRDTWGLTWLDMSPGSHEVCFSDVAGYSTPPCQTVSVVAGAATTVTGSFGRMASLQVTTSPALPATITLRDLTLSTPAVALDDWGVFSFVTAGHAYEICFGAVAGYAAPACQLVAAGEAAPGASISRTGIYASAPAEPGPTGKGFLRAVTSPALPSMISVDGVPRDMWGLDWLKLDPGPHQVCFDDVTGYATPPCQEITTVAGQTSVVTGSFAALGWIHATTVPPSEATVVVDDVARNDWGAWFPIAGGPHEVCFVVAGTKVRCHDVTVVPDATVEVSSAPLFALPGAYSLSNAAISADGSHVVGIRSGPLGETDVVTWPVPADASSPFGAGTIITTEDNFLDNSITSAPEISADGRYVVYGATDGDQVSGDDNGFTDVFVWDRQTNTTQRITDGNGDSGDADISSTGRYVTFTSDATNLAGSGDSNLDVYVWDRQVAGFSRVTNSGAGKLEPRISSDGRYVGFSSYSDLIPPDSGFGDIYLFDRVNLSLVSPLAGRSEVVEGSGFDLDMSDDGRLLTFTAIPFVPQPSVETVQVFSWDRLTNVLTQRTSGSTWHASPSISGDGSKLVYERYTDPGNSFDVVLDATWSVPGLPYSPRPIPDSSQSASSVSNSGIVAFDTAADLLPSDTNGYQKIYVFR